MIDIKFFSFCEFSAAPLVHDINLLSAIIIVFFEGLKKLGEKGTEEEEEGMRKRGWRGEG